MEPGKPSPHVPSVEKEKGEAVEDTFASLPTNAFLDILTSPLKGTKTVEQGCITDERILEKLPKATADIIRSVEGRIVKLRDVVQDCNDRLDTADDGFRAPIAKVVSAVRSEKAKIENSITTLETQLRDVCTCSATHKDLSRQIRETEMILDKNNRSMYVNIMNSIELEPAAAKQKGKLCKQIEDLQSVLREAKMMLARPKVQSKEDLRNELKAMETRCHKIQSMKMALEARVASVEDTLSLRKRSLRLDGPHSSQKHHHLGNAADKNDIRKQRHHRRHVVKLFAEECQNRARLEQRSEKGDDVQGAGAGRSSNASQSPQRRSLRSISIDSPGRSIAEEARNHISATAVILSNFSAVEKTADTIVVPRPSEFAPTSTFSTQTKLESVAQKVSTEVRKVSLKSTHETDASSNIAISRVSYIYYTICNLLHHLVLVVRRNLQEIMKTLTPVQAPMPQTDERQHLSNTSIRGRLSNIRKNNLFKRPARMSSMLQ